MKREFLKGLGLEQAAIDAIMAEHGTDAEGLKDQISTLIKENLLVPYYIFFLSILHFLQSNSYRELFSYLM